MTRLTIGIDGFNLAMPRGTGVATYGLGLAEAVAALGHATLGVFGIDVGDRADSRELLFYDRIGKERAPETRKQHRRRLRRETFRSFLPAHAHEVPVTDAVEKQAFAGRLPRFDRLVSSPALFDVADRRLRRAGTFLTLRMPDPPAIMHWTYPVPIRLEGARNVYTLHDLVPLKLPYTTLDDKRHYRRLIELCVTEGDHICTVSESSRADILALFPGVAPDKVTNSYQTAPVPAELLARDPAEDAGVVEGLFGLKRRGYFLFFGALDPKKNLARIIEAYLTSRSETPLVIVGARHWGTEQEARIFGDQKKGVSLYGEAAAKGLVQLDYLPREMLLRLVRGAKAVMFPSLYEGFGLPALEAIRLGTPVISSTISSLPEVVGDAGLLVDPYDAGAIAGAMRALDEDPALAARLSAAAPAQAARFSDEAYRARLAAMYERVLSN
ncbi:glycosyltransferase family 4 protein [Rhizorhabdus wittichii]|uniref:Glycosyltransferase family 4 protein n=1 Tax=Rhizorhabdus wittichii TaxID=160791 RepID=A0A975HBV0_9SPHN|nr:glycosyltransferase family 1 protein [Rhizorhabdus wittichii]QTH19558.1 glycosyltransferase family 4 protein [Rhizorhabdus wittichii]